MKLQQKQKKVLNMHKMCRIRSSWADAKYHPRNASRKRKLLCEYPLLSVAMNLTPYHTYSKVRTTFYSQLMCLNTLDKWQISGSLPTWFANQPPWLSWVHIWQVIGGWSDWRPGGRGFDAEVGNILSWRLIIKYFLRSFSPFRWFKKGSCQFLAKECA